MNHFKETMGSIFLMTAQNEALYEVIKPAMLFDKELFVVHKIGNEQDVLKYYEKAIEKCKQTGSNLFESWVVMNLPLDANILDKILQRTGNLESILKNELGVKIEF